MLILPYRRIYVYTSIRQYKFMLAQIALQTLYGVIHLFRLLAMEWLFRPSLACLFRQLRFLIWLTVVPIAIRHHGISCCPCSRSLSAYLPASSFPFFGIDSHFYNSPFTRFQGLIEVVVYSFPPMSMCISRCCKRCQPPLLFHPLSTFHFKSVHAFFSFFR